MIPKKIALLIALFLLQSCVHSLPVHSSYSEYLQVEDRCNIANRDDVRLQLRLKDDRRVFSPDDKIEAELVLTNQSDFPLLVNSRFKTGQAKESLTKRDIYFCITKDGEQYQKTFFAYQLSWEAMKRIMVRRTHFIKLLPGDAYSKEVPIYIEAMPPYEAGTYRAFAVYENYYMYSRFSKKSTFIGAVASNTVEFVIE
ncbi:hypothetical protein ACFL6Q_05310 [Candidatus Neomarinimicrobiota bacterium]